MFLMREDPIIVQGVGPATASALLAAYDRAFPFMSDEALTAATGDAKDYSLKRYLDFATALREKAEQLSSSGVSLIAFSPRSIMKQP